MAYTPNPGHLPSECEIRDKDGNITGYHQVRVKLFNGISTGPWPSAGGRPHPTRWSISRPPHPFEIEEWELA